ncbi:hypothetical protein [Calycomorphotria hydatis]|uniref:Uncharacterized protein n=1 Tax=Calycomorphotria hydatis TaxID=2528027 RepID=A0A517TES3_9PLAN|nr:hypothetical protein [Calycomorphotria hydatis]QDT66878.1 hypothetical protein V22_41500 [Calycomorphotria hydatis]
MKPVCYLIPCLMLLVADVAVAQLRPTRIAQDFRQSRSYEFRGTKVPGGDYNPAELTTITIELLTSGITGGIQAQQWAQRLERFGHSVRIRQALSGEKVSVEEKNRGRLRYVTVVGQIDRQGELIFPERSFNGSEIAELGEWLNELKTYGAQGAPDGQAAWGLNQIQFKDFYNAMSEPNEADLAGLSLEQALRKLTISSDYSQRFTTAAKELVDSANEANRTVTQSPFGLTKGTTLAAVLNEFALGFRPLRTPDGSIELVIESLAETSDVWPLGWDLDDENNDRVKLAPELFELTNVAYREGQFRDVLHAIEAETGIPILLNHHRLTQGGVEYKDLKVKVEPRKTSWSITLRRLTLPHFMKREIKRDEAGHSVVVISPSRG